MAAAAATQTMMRPLQNHILGSNAAPLRQHTPQPSNKAEEEAREREFVAHYKDYVEVLSEAQIAQEPKDKELGKTSSTLKHDDFELIKTLGTGMHRSRMIMGRPIWNTKLGQSQGHSHGCGYPDLQKDQLKIRRKCML